MADTKQFPAAGSTPPVTLTVENRIEQFLEENFKKIMLGLVLVGLVLAAVFASRHVAARRNLQAAEKFASATSLEDCDNVIQKYPGGAAAGNALLQKADLLWQQGKKESSIAALQEFLKSLPAHKLRASAMVALGSKQAAIGDKEAGRATLEAFLKSNPQSELAPAADLQLGDLLWLEGRDAEAKKHFDSLLQKYPGKMAMFNDALEERQQLLGSGLPQKEVAGPPPAPKPAFKPPAPKWPKITLPYLRPHDSAPAPVPVTTATPPVQVPPPAPAQAAPPAGDKPVPTPAKPNP